MTRDEQTHQVDPLERVVVFYPSRIWASFEALTHAEPTIMDALLADKGINQEQIADARRTVRAMDGLEP